MGNVIQDGPYGAILWQDGRRHDLNDEVAEPWRGTLKKATGINGRGEIVGIGERDRKEVVFHLTPR